MAYEVSATTVAIDKFTEEFDQLLAAKPDQTWKTAGKATKAWPNGEDQKFWRENAPKWVKGYADWRYKNPQYQLWYPSEGIPAIELAVSVQVPDSDITLKGYIDRVFVNTEDNSLLVVDLKTGRSAQTSPLQLAFYALALKQQFNVDVRYGSYYSAREGGLDKVYDLMQFPTEMVSRWLRNADKIIKQDLFTPSIGMGCSWCSLKKDCYVWTPDVERPNFGSDTPSATADTDS